MFCAYWVSVQAWGSVCFEIPTVIESVCLQVNDQLRKPGLRVLALMELLTHICRSSIYDLLWFGNLLLMRLWVWNAYLVLLWNRAWAYPRALLHSGGPLSCEFWQLTIPLNEATSINADTKHNLQNAGARRARSSSDALTCTPLANNYTTKRIHPKTYLRPP